MTGFLTPDYADRYPEARAELAALLRDGRLISREQIIEGGVRAFPERCRRCSPARTSAS